MIAQCRAGVYKNDPPFHNSNGHGFGREMELNMYVPKATQMLADFCAAAELADPCIPEDVVVVRIEAIEEIRYSGQYRVWVRTEKGKYPICAHRKYNEFEQWGDLPINVEPLFKFIRSAIVESKYGKWHKKELEAGERFPFISNMISQGKTFVYLFDDVEVLQGRFVIHSRLLRTTEAERQKIREDAQKAMADRRNKGASEPAGKFTKSAAFHIGLYHSAPAGDVFHDGNE